MSTYFASWPEEEKYKLWSLYCENTAAPKPLGYVQWCELME
jgi:hypothetical protein